MSLVTGRYRKGAVRRLVELAVDLAGRLITSPGEAQIDASASNVHTIPTGTSTRYTLPTAGGVYAITAKGDSAYIKGGDNAVAVTTGDYREYIADGKTWGPYKLPDAVTDVAVIGTGGSGELIFQEIKAMN